MCIIVGRSSSGMIKRIERVSGTNIFARHTTSDRQIIVYSMNIASSIDLAMILPIPVTANSQEESVRFISLQKYPRFFRDMQRGFPEWDRSSMRAMTKESGGASPRLVKLPVYSVGRFEASYVPSINDWDRLDERFRLPENVWESLPQYNNYGFAVFKLRKTTSLFGYWDRIRTIHPMAFEFPSAMPSQLFFPTVHVHDGKLHKRAAFDHSLFTQLSDDGSIKIEADSTYNLPVGWETSYSSADEFMRIDRCKKTILSSLPVFRRTLKGMLPNRDTLVPRESVQSNSDQ